MTTKQRVYQRLVQEIRTDSFISGQDLAESCSVSRTAVWKAVKALRKNGIMIEAVTNKGYRLVSEPLSEEAVLSYLPADFPGTVSVFPSIDSTSTAAKRLCVESGALRDASGELTPAGVKLHRSVLIAGEQTAGRGRLGRTFYSPPKTGLYASLIYAPPGGIKNPARMTAAAAVAVCRVLKKLYQVSPKIKWVNDVFLDGKKICGILTEGISNFETGHIETAVVGIGINIAENTGIPPELRSVAGAVLSDPAVLYSRNKLAASLLMELLAIYDGESDVFPEYKRLSLNIGKKVHVTPLVGSEMNAYDGEVLDIDSEARLVVRTPDGKIRRLQSGEITLESKNFSTGR
jgi:BirA family biotin operon repressor/biotin-[acetyl-CoA-carboxylase] ligase